MMLAKPGWKRRQGDLSKHAHGDAQGQVHSKGAKNTHREVYKDDTDIRKAHARTCARITRVRKHARDAADMHADTKVRVHKGHTHRCAQCHAQNAAERAFVHRKEEHGDMRRNGNVDMSTEMHQRCARPRHVSGDKCKNTHAAVCAPMSARIRGQICARHTAEIPD